MAIALPVAGCDDECLAGDECASANSTLSTSGTGAAGGAPTPLALDYCDCMLLSCHDSYHQAFGSEAMEVQARANCLAAAQQLPVAGMEVMAGDFVECRIHHCELGKTDESACPASIGEEVCQ